MRFQVTNGFDWRDTEWMKYYLRTELDVTWNMWKTIEFS